jgi:hypothetical protein
MVGLCSTDYNVALHDTTFHLVPIEIICYHCEKALKAILAYHDEIIPHIHTGWITIVWRI